jgi:hypothetical protein
VAIKQMQDEDKNELVIRGWRQPFHGSGHNAG